MPQMDYFTITAIALGLSFDTFAVSLSYGVMQNKILFRSAVRIALIFAVFQGGLTIAGYFLGSMISESVKTANQWIAFGLLGFLGLKMIIEGLRKNENRKAKDYSKPAILITIAIGTSIDAFTVGVSFALLDVMIWISGTIIASVTFLASMAAIRLGKLTGKRLGNKVEIIGGLILIAIGLKIFLEHILAA